MKKYVSPIVELNDALDIIATSADVTTGSIKLPWSDNKIESSYELLSLTRMEPAKENSYDLG